MKSNHNLLDTKRLLNVRNRLTNNKSDLTGELIHRVALSDRFKVINITNPDFDVKTLFSIPFGSVMVDQQG